MEIEVVQQRNLEEAKKYTYETDELSILTELQHYGAKTNLIDFTANYLIALFFACDSNHLQRWEGNPIGENRGKESVHL